MHKSEFTQIKLKNLLHLLEIYINKHKYFIPTNQIEQDYSRKLQDKQKFIEHKAQFLAALKRG